MNRQSTDDAFDERPSRYIVGIDLGTTNCAVAYLDTEIAAGSIETLRIEQWVDFGTRQQRELLPSFVYQPLAEERQLLEQGGGADSDHLVGWLARERGLQLPGRQVVSAKSWLCHDGVDRNEAILPWQGDEDVAKMSPVDASAMYLRRIREHWDGQFPGQRLADQDIVLTLPASFDQVARQLTIEAAARAGLKRILPIEEPQAAFYAWLSRHEADWQQQVAPGQTILVCDIGGGTTDFTLIRAREASQAIAEEEQTLEVSQRQQMSLHRVAVGKHLILGGDNIDLALAQLAESKLASGGDLPARTWDALRQACRVAKETLLAADAPDSHSIHLPGSGARLIGGGQQVTLTKVEVAECVLDGFFGACALTDRPTRQQAGFQEFGLPFATDASITKHLAAFLWDHREAGRPADELAGMSSIRAARPDWILFNGGVLASGQLRDRIVAAIANWFADDADMAWRPGVLEGARMEQAVAVGAAYFGRVRRGSGVAIEAKLACSYYLQTSHDPPQALCLVPGSASPGDRFPLTEQTFELAVGEPVQFPVVYSSIRLADQVGETVEMDDEQFSRLPPIRTVLELSRGRQQKTLPVRVEVELTQIGTLQLYCQAIDAEHRWKLEFDVRASTQTDREMEASGGQEASVQEDTNFPAAEHALQRVFTLAGDLKPSKLNHALVEALQLGRGAWSPGLLRGLWAALMDLQEGRRRSAAHEARWLNLLGFSLRPGFGLAADDWRVARTWRAVHGKLAFGTASSRSESLILWRRIAGGFSAGQQLTVYQQIAGPVRGVLDPTRRAKGSGGVSPQELVELLRLVGSLELLPKSEKHQLGDWLLQLATVKKWLPCRSAMLWTLGRLGARVPAYGPLNCVADPSVVSAWIERLCQLDSDPNLALALMLCGRRVHDRYRDVRPDTRELALQRLRAEDAPEHYLQLIDSGGELRSEEASEVLGESLPLGLRLAT